MVPGLSQCFSTSLNPSVRHSFTFCLGSIIKLMLNLSTGITVRIFRTIISIFILTLYVELVMFVLFISTESYDSMVYLAITLPIIILILLVTLIITVIFFKKKRWGIYFWNLNPYNNVNVMLMQHQYSFTFSHRNSDRLGNGVLYASVNPEYFSAAESKYSFKCIQWLIE